jgi:hypothetical protein
MRLSISSGYPTLCRWQIGSSYVRILISSSWYISKLILSNSQHLEEIVSIAKERADANGYLAQANFKLAQIYGKMGNDTQKCHYMAAAEATREEILGYNNLPKASEDEYAKLTTWMLW